jgi:hypothetical protein
MTPDIYINLEITALFLRTICNHGVLLMMLLTVIGHLIEIHSMVEICTYTLNE